MSYVFWRSKHNVLLLFYDWDIFTFSEEKTLVESIAWRGHDGIRTMDLTITIPDAVSLAGETERGNTYSDRGGVFPVEPDGKTLRRQRPMGDRGIERTVLQWVGYPTGMVINCRLALFYDSTHGQTWVPPPIPQNHDSRQNW